MAVKAKTKAPAGSSKSYPWASREERLEHQRLERKLVRAASVEAEVTGWLWLDRIPKGRLTVVAGRPGQGKSLFSAALAAEITRQGGACIISNPEDTRADVQVPRFLAAEADTRLIHFWPGKLRVPSDLEDLEALIGFHGIKLVVLDPIRKHVETSDPALSLEPLAAMCERTGVAVVGIHHLNKRAGKTEHPMDALSGNLSDFVGSARAVYAFGPVPGHEPETRILAPVKMNHGPTETSVEFYLDGDVEVDLPNGDVATPARVVFVSNKSRTDALAVVTYNGGFGYKNETPEKKQVAAEFLTLLLMRGPVPAKKVFDKGVEVGVSKMTLRRAAEDLGVVKKRIGFGPGSYLTWELPAGHPALAAMGGLLPPSGGDGDDEQMDVDSVIAQILGEQKEDSDE